MIHEFRPMFFDLSQHPPKELKEQYDPMWMPRHVTVVKWDPECDFVIELGDVISPFALEDFLIEFQKRLDAENVQPAHSATELTRGEPI